MIFSDAMATSWCPGPVAKDVEAVPDGSVGYVEKREKRIIVTTVGWSKMNGPGTGTDIS
jgi:hypothetical protein